MKAKQVKEEILKEFSPKFNINEVFNKMGYTILENRGKKYCGCCGEEIDTTKLKRAKCYKCNAHLRPLDRYAKTKTYVTYPYTSYYYAKSYKLGDWQLIRTFVLWNSQAINKKATETICKEVMRIAISQDAQIVFAKKRTNFCMWNWDWVYDSDFSVKQFTDKYDFNYTYTDYSNKADCFKYLDFNASKHIMNALRKIRNYDYHYTIIDLLKDYTKNPKFMETLIKLNRTDLLACYVNNYRTSYKSMNNEVLQDCLFMLARKNKNIPTDNYENYTDYLSACVKINKDLKNIDILCPTDFEVADSRVQRKASEQKAQQEAQQRVEDNKKYIQRVGKLINQDFGNDKYSVLIIPSVKDFYFEGKVYFKNCCYNMEYFNKKNSLVFVIFERKTMKRCEIAELRENKKKSYDIQQCYGACNKTTENHDEIVSLLASQVKNIRNCLRG